MNANVTIKLIPQNKRILPILSEGWRLKPIFFKKVN